MQDEPSTGRTASCKGMHDTVCGGWSVSVFVLCKVQWTEGYAGNPKFSNQSHPAQPEGDCYPALTRVQHDISTGQELFMDYGEMTDKLMGIEPY